MNYFTTYFTVIGTITGSAFNSISCHSLPRSYCVSTFANCHLLCSSSNLMYNQPTVLSHHSEHNPTLCLHVANVHTLVPTTHTHTHVYTVCATHLSSSHVCCSSIRSFHYVQYHRNQVFCVKFHSNIQFTLTMSQLS